MNKNIPAIVTGALLAVSMMAPTLSNNASAQVGAESRVLQAILALTELIKSDSSALVETTDNIADDLEFKKKFYSVEYFVSPTGTSAPVLMLVDECPNDDQDACAFNVESIQLIDAGTPRNVTAIEVDGVVTDISDKQITTRTNLLVDSGIGKFGASSIVIIRTDGGFTGDVIVTGEKPQGMRLLISDD